MGRGDGPRGKQGRRARVGGWVGAGYGGERENEREEGEGGRVGGVESERDGEDNRGGKGQQEDKKDGRENEREEGEGWVEKGSV